MSNLSKIEDIYHAALEKPLAEREAFLNEACDGDAELRREIESLLAFDEKAQDFIETPPEDLAAALFSKGANRDIIGKTVGHYRVLSPLGAGGMGEVYLAQDKKLGRKIALKLLPTQFAADTERKKRFEQEARAVSALNHPNILTIYGIEESENINFIATEFIDGQTLRERISEKPLSWRETIEVAVQITSALESAHAVGIIHRDIKPANIMIRKDGIVKVLDFGLAKLTLAEADSGDVETRENTAPNCVMGTINYMSPEQALGEKVDARTDIFSLGTVLYEMLSGEQPFAGASDAAVYNATINKTPPSVCESNAEIPRALDHIVKRALAKDRTNRYQTASDLSRDLLTLKQNSNSNLSNEFFIASERKSKSAKIFLPIAAAVGAILLSLSAFYWYSNRATNNKTAAVKNLNYTQLTSQSGEELFPNLAPDGKTIIYSSRESGNWDIYFQRVGGSNAVNLTKDSADNDKQAVYSPNGDVIAFRSERLGGGLFVMGATGESVRRISDAGFYPSWSPDGKEIVFSSADFAEPTERVTESRLWALDLATGAKRQITTEDGIQPSWSPNGHRIAYWGLNKNSNRDIKTLSAEGGEPVTVTDDAALDWNPVWSPDGKYLYFVSNRGGSMNLWRVAIDEQSGIVAGQPEPITTPSQYSQHLTFSRDGKQFAFGQLAKITNIQRVTFDSQTETLGDKPAEITRGGKIMLNTSASPDGEWLASDSTKDGQEDIFVMKSDGTGMRQLTNDVYKDRAPQWSPDGQQLIFYSNRSGKDEAWKINADGSNLQQVTNAAGQVVVLAIWSPDGKKILGNILDSDPIIIESDKAWEQQTPQRLPKWSKPKEWLMAYSWSSDGEKLACFLNGSFPINGITVYDFAAQKYEEMTKFGESPVWLNDNRRIIFFETDKIYLLDTKTKKTKELLSLAPNTMQSIRISNDNRFLYYNLRKNETDIWLATAE